MGLLLLLSLALLTSSFFSETESASFKIVNKCRHTIWPGVLSGANTEPLSPTGFALKSGKSRTLSVPRSWSGRMWARTLCSGYSPGNFSCLTADCGSGRIECAGSGAKPPATLVEFTLNGADGLDFYDVSLVDGYNLPVLVVPRGGTGGGCSPTGCLVDLNGACPKALRVTREGGGSGGVVACRSACEAFGEPQFCCSEAFATPDTCAPSVFSLYFKHVCPRAYSYAYDDKTSTYTCASADYIIIFCPKPYTSSSGMLAARNRYYLNTLHRSRLRSAGDPQMPSDTDTKILFRYDTVTANRWLEAPEPIVYGPATTLRSENCFVLLSDVKLRSKRPMYWKLIADMLSKVGLPGYEQSAVIEKLFRLFKAAISGHRITARVLDVTLCYLDSSSGLQAGTLDRFLWPYKVVYGDGDHMFTNTVVMQSMEASHPKLIPTNESFIEGLERVRADSLQSDIRQTPCSICFEGLDHFAVEPGMDEQLLLTRLPCSHLFHGDCILLWRQRNHLCPICRYAMPTMEVKPSNSSERAGRLDLVKMSAVALVTTATYVALKLFKPS